MSLGERIKELRKRNKLTQTELAQQICSSQNNISKYERDETAPNPDTLRLLALVLGTTSDYLIGVPGARAIVKTQASPVFDQLIEVTKDFSGEESAKLLDYAVMLKKSR